MKKIVVLLCLAVIAAGCASTMSVTKFTSQNRENLSRLSVGMPFSSALDVMGNNPIVLSCPNEGKKTANEITVANPYRTETMRIADRNFEVVYYAVNVAADGKVDESTLVPLVFENKKLIGWGQTYLDGLKK